MKRRCKKCGMIRAEKDLVHLKDETYLCFACWNKEKYEQKSTAN
ncbi:MAG: hypothetical protein BAJALOKI1v1_2170004 [Promethearchaeota archaeon]|nr:MAG: hypothetical protein BAJALOKI1v1_2170004 [Candidatus Lokiarchaeota archaeon]